MSTGKGKKNENVIAALQIMKESYSGVDADAYNEKIDYLIAEIESREDDSDLSDIEEGIMSLTDLLANGGFEDKSKTAEQTKKISDSLTQISSLISGFSDLRTANKQIREAKSSLRNIEEPTAPSRFKKSELLASQIRDIKQGMTPAEMANRTAGLRSDINESYLKDINNAKIASTGQAGSYGSYSQAASRQRLRNALALQEQQNSIRANDMASLNSLASLDVQQNRFENASDAGIADFNYRKYLDKSNAAGSLLKTGNLNKRYSRDSLLSSVNGLAPYIQRASDGLSDGLNNNPYINPFDRVRRGRGSLDQKYGIQAAPVYKEPLYDFTSEDSFLDFNEKLNNYNSRYIS